MDLDELRQKAAKVAELQKLSAKARTALHEARKEYDRIGEELDVANFELSEVTGRLHAEQGVQTTFHHWHE